MITSISKYKVIDKLGQGGMGEVYKAEDPGLLRTVAVKVIARGAQTAEAEKRFLREARAASSLNHPNIVIIYEIGETDEHSYIAMEYVEGKSLRQLIADRSLTAAQIEDIARQSCLALEEAHARGLIHRDIKPENVLVSTRAQVKLLDFGLAKPVPGIRVAADAGDRLTESGVVMGTLSYMSPEQLRNESLDERTDLFSFGIVLHELITGKLPFKGANSFEVAASILKDEADTIEEMPPGLSPSFVRIVSRLLEKDRQRRYGSFAELRREIESVSRGSLDEQATLDLEQMRRSNEQLSPADSMRTKPRLAAPTILVFPLEAVDAAEETAFVGIGLAHAITTDLAKIRGLSVLSKWAGAGRGERAGRNARETARELGATIVLEGEVMRAGTTIGVMARLTDVETSRVIWGSQYRGDAADLFSIQDAVCESVADALKVNVSTEVRQQIARPATQNIFAFEFYSKGRAFIERRDVKENIDLAIAMFERALELDPNFALAHAGLGEAYWRKYQASHESAWVEHAIAASDHALLLDPYQAQVHVALGIIYHGTGRIERAIEEFERAIDLQPTCDEAYQWLGRCSKRKGEPEKAVKYFERAIELRPGYWDNYNALGSFYYTFGRYRDAAEQFRRVITIQPDNSRGYSNLGVMYYFQGLYEDAVAMYQKAIGIHPNEDSYANLGTAYFYLGRYEEAITAYEAAISMNPAEDQHYWNLGDAFVRVGRERDAEVQFRRAEQLLEEQLRVDPNDARRLGQLALYRAKLRRFDEALELINRATKLEPRNTTLMYKKAVVSALTGDANQAVTFLGSALEHGYSRAEAARDPDLESLREIPEYGKLFSQSD